MYYDHVKTQHPTDSLETPAVMGRSGRDTDSGLQMDLRHALALLTDAERTCVVLQLMEGQSIDHITMVTGMREGTVKLHLSRGKKKMADYLRHNGYDRQ